MTKSTFIKIWEKFVAPLIHACPTCKYALHGSSLDDADDCMHDDYDGGDPACVDGWWEDNMCTKWELTPWLEPVVDEIAPLPFDKLKELEK